MNDVLDSTVVKAITTIQVFIVMYRYGLDYWSASCGTYKTLEDAQGAASLKDGGTAWRIIRVSGLPIQPAKGEL